MVFFLKGIAFGFCIAAPVGPIAVLCLRRTLKSGPLNGFVTGLGVATADSFYGLCAGFGLLSSSNIVVSHQVAMRLIGGIGLLVIGTKILISEPPGAVSEIQKKSLLVAFISAFLITVSNPITIVSFAALFAALGLASQVFVNQALLVGGIFIGSSLWWLFLSQATHRFRERMPQRLLHIFNFISGLVLVISGAATLLSLLKNKIF